MQNGGKALFAGNGGSAGDAQHIAGEFVSRLNFDRAPLAGLALTTDTSVLTAIGNDYGYADVFSRQVRGLGRSGDVFVAITTSGNSPNILKAVEAARDMGIVTIGLTGKSGGKLAAACDICLHVPSDSTPLISAGAHCRGASDLRPRRKRDVRRRRDDATERLRVIRQAVILCGGLGLVSAG